jgi:FkbM family methyltransferase
MLLRAVRAGSLVARSGCCNSLKDSADDMAMRDALAPLIPPSILSQLQRFKAELAIRRFSPRLVHHTYGVHQLNIHLHDPMSAAWYDCDWSRPAEFQLLEASRLQPGALVFDVGAHQGVMAMLLAKEVASYGQVVAIEPHPFNVHVAKLNLLSNSIKNVTLIESMLSTSNAGGLVSFQLNAVASPGQRFGRKVQSVTLDHLVNQFGWPAVVYLDIEGFEAEVLTAAYDLLDAPIDWCVELHGDDVLRRYRASNAAIVGMYLAKGFRISMITERLEIIDVKTEEDVPTERCHIVAVKRPNPRSAVNGVGADLVAE